MSESVCLTFLMLYYIIAMALYFRKPEFRRFMHIIVIPLPIAMLITYFFLPEHYTSRPPYYEILAQIVVGLSLFAGIGVLFHCYMDRVKADWLLKIRLVAAILLIINPLLLFYPDIYLLTIVSYLAAGTLLGIYGFITYYKGQNIGIIYVYFSLAFMVIVPAISFALAMIYFNNIEPDIIYRSAWDGIVTCHLPAMPLIPKPEAFETASIFSAGYAGFIAILTDIRLTRLRKKMESEGTITNEFLEILNSRKKPDE